MKLEISVREALNLHAAYRGLHGIAKSVKHGSGQQITLVPFNLSGLARPIMTDNTAVLQPIVKAHEETVAIMKAQAEDELEAKTNEIEQQFSDDDLREKQIKRAEDELNRRIDRDVQAALNRKKAVDLEPIDRKSLNEELPGNTFDPGALATLLNAGLLVAKGKAKTKQKDPAEAD